MDENLFEAIKDAKSLAAYILALDGAICRLSKNPDATAMLTEDFRKAIVREQEWWRHIEAMPEFKAKYDATRRGITEAKFDFDRDILHH